jgi:CheY-like chemotaxis protein
MKVLVVDDSATSRNILKDILETFSFDVTLAASGEEGLEEIEKADREQPYGLVLMDWKMPGLDGIETSRRIKDNRDLSKIPAIIMVTAYGREEIIQQAGKIGLDGFLIKPIGPSVLFDTVMDAFGESITSATRITERTDEIEGLKDIQGARVLLVEDNEINQQVAKEILSGGGLHVTVANDGQEAVDAVQENHYDAVLMDIQMPVMDGYQATLEIRKHKTLQDLPIIAMTASAMTQDREEAFEVGMNGHVAKPIDTKDLFSTLVKWITPGERETPGVISEKVGEEKTEKEPFPAELPGISIGSGLSKLAGNEELYRKLLSKFRESNRDVVNEIKGLIDAGDMETAARLAHTVKGVAGNLGAEDLFPAAGELEKALKQGEAGSLERLIGHFEDLLNVVLHSIGDLEQKEDAKSEKETTEGGEAVDIGAVSPLLTEMAQLLETDLTEAMDRLAEIKPYLSRSPVSEKYRKLEMAMEEFDTDGALKSLEEIIKSLDRPL